MTIGNRSCTESEIELFESFLIKNSIKNKKITKGIKSTKNFLNFLEHSKLTPAVLDEASIVKIESPNEKYQNTCFRNNLRIKLKNYLNMKKGVSVCHANEVYKV